MNIFQLWLFLNYKRIYFNMISKLLNRQITSLCRSQMLKVVPIRQMHSMLKVRYGFTTGVKAEKRQFKAQTKKLLDIVAKSLYTDSEVFIRQLLSNSSDALEKQRFSSQSSNDLSIRIDLHPNKSQIVISDNGIGMTKQDLINNLGTIARSGSKEFVEKAINEGGSKVGENIIGQFGVGFYSSFIVADRVEVVSKVQNSPAYLWASDGQGQFEISQFPEADFQRGTKITLYIKSDESKYLQKGQIQKIIQKYSNFINYPISINGQTTNIVKAIWWRDKKQVSEEEYSNFYKQINEGSSEEYKFKIHFHSDVPLSIKSIMFVPKNHSEKYGFGQEKGEVSLYSKKVLIKKNCKQILLPNFLRFVKGIVDCEDIPLNISRQNYQDSALMNKIKHFITKKILKMLKDQAEKHPAVYNQWYHDFAIFIKEGSLDQEFKKQVIPLNRYETNTSEGFINLNDYIKLKKPAQDRIFYLFSPNKVVSKDSPYLYPLTKAGVPVIIANTHIDQIIFRDIDTYEGLKFSNIETDPEDVERVLKSLQSEADKQTSQNRIKEQDITTFSLWIKNELQPYVDKVVVSKKKINGPALVISPISSAMRQMTFMRQMMEEKTKTAGNPRSDLKGLTFEYNPEDPLIYQLNQFRKNNKSSVSSMVVRQIFDNCCMESGIESDSKNMIQRINILMKTVLQNKSNQPEQPQPHVHGPNCNHGHHHKH